jgi:serine-type D-Ala-D-Ala carboxypeptidase (penicillin-binding protein 5/6)
MRSNETFTYREAVYAMLLRNANEAAMGLAYSLSGGDLAGWVSQMNTLSQRIGTTGSTWTDACGLDSGNVTTAVDMYLILRYLMSFDAFVDISSAPTFTMPAKEKHTKSFVLLNQNVALNKTSGGSFYRKSMQGGMCNVMAYKNDHGDQSYVSWANQDGSTYIFCIMQSPDTCDTYGYANRRPALYETTRLIDWVFQSFSIQPALDTDLALAEIPVKYSSDTDTLKLYPDNSMMTLLPSSGDGTVTQKYFHLPDYVCAPVQQGDVVGTVELKLAGETIGMVNLIAGQDVSRSSLLYSFSKLQEFFGSLYLKVVLVVSAICAIIYVAWVLLNSPHTHHPSKKVHRYGRPRD